MSKANNQLRPIDEPIYGYFSALYLSFYSRRLYVDVGKRWRGLGIFYLFLTIIVFSIPFCLRIAISLNDSFREQITDPLLQIPIIYIQNGIVSFDKPMPYFIKNDKDQVVVIIDTSGTINDFSEAYPDATILINKTKIALRVPRLKLYNITQTEATKGPPLVQNFDKGTNLVFDGKKIAEQNSVTLIKYFSEVIIYPIVVGLLCSVFIVFFLVLGFLGQVFSSIFFSFKIPFATSVRLLIVAGTPMMLFFLIILTLNYLFTSFGSLLLAVLVGYYSLALYFLRAESRRVAQR